MFEDKIKIINGVTVTNLSLQLFISCEFYLPKTKSIVSGSPSFTITLSSLAARSVLLLACSQGLHNSTLLARGLLIKL